MLIGLFVGGAARRMGEPKGLLAVPPRFAAQSGETVVERLARIAASALPGAPICLVGENPAYAHLPFPFLADARPQSGPLGGLVALLMEAERLGSPSCLALGCDFPFVSAHLLQEIVAAEPAAPICAPWLEGYFQPLLARYQATLLAPFRAALGRGHLALQPLLREHGAHRLILNEEESDLLIDWDTQEDRDRSPSSC
jgi:molybdopterin-guanine dinucleotide biosynthesis protein A